MKKLLLSILFIFGLLLVAWSQVDKTQALAKQYYQTGDYQKAAAMFEELWKQEPNNTYYYSSLYNCYLRLNEYSEAEILVKKQSKRDKNNLSYIIDLGYIYSQNNRAKDAQEQYDLVLNSLLGDQNEIRSIANKFLGIRQNDYAIKSYLKGRELAKDKSLYTFELGNVYLQDNQAKEAVSTYLQLLEDNPNYLNTVQSIMANNLDKKGLQDALETQLYSLVQKNTNRNEYNELLIWLFTHQGDYDQALIQAKALDKRNQEDGFRIINLANSAVQEKQYDAAIDAYRYLQSKGESGRYYQLAKSSQINAQKLKLTTTLNYTQDDILSLEQSYLEHLEKFGKGLSTVPAMRDLAHLEANYLHQLKLAISLLNEIIALPNLDKKTKNEVKLDLGDYYVLDGDVWEATLLYAQVDKDEKDSPIGEDARYRNARLSYYKGEFEWSQAQLGILKGATTELIANNSLQLSVFIMDNLGLDSTTTTMELFADAELMHIQNKDKKAVELLDSILYRYPGHALTDDVYLKKAQISFENRNFNEAINNLNALLLNHSEDILADNALFMLGDIYQNYLNNPDKAMEAYKSIITDYSDSVLMVEARKRFRFLRGDDI
ncbi:MAG: tetratricopeptide repeat protein [Chitinophagales bacterium]